MSCYILPTTPSVIKYAYYPTLYLDNSQCCGSVPACHHYDVQVAMCPGKNPVSPAMAHPSATGTAILLPGPLDSVGPPVLLQAPGSLFYPVLDDLPNIAHPVETYTRQESMMSYTDSFNVGLRSLSIFGTASCSPSSSSSSINASPGFNRLSFGRSYRRPRRKEAKCVDDNQVLADGERYPLYCSICRVTLNAQIQARQHYSGKQHARRLRVLSRGRSEGSVKVKATCDVEGLQEPMAVDWTSNESSVESGATVEIEEEEDLANTIGSSKPEVNRTQRRTDVIRSMNAFEGISCDIYCMICAVSFNSATQARQHYHGKSHARRLRTTSTGRRTCSFQQRKCLNGFTAKQLVS